MFKTNTWPPAGSTVTPSGADSGEPDANRFAPEPSAADVVTRFEPMSSQNNVGVPISTGRSVGIGEVVGVAGVIGAGIAGVGAAGSGFVIGADGLAPAAPIALGVIVPLPMFGFAGVGFVGAGVATGFEVTPDPAAPSVLGTAGGVPVLPGGDSASLPQPAKTRTKAASPPSLRRMISDLTRIHSPCLQSVRASAT